jgi:two-component system, cell cycle response regulator DivK
MSTGDPILIIDDNPINLQLVEDLLVLEGYTVRSASSALEALEMLKTFIPKLILMDIQLPGMDGLELTHKLKADSRYKDIIILAITALAMKHDKKKALAAGCDGYISKPIDIDQLVEDISGYL